MLSCLYVQGPTLSTVFCKRDGIVTVDYYSMVICVPKMALNKSIRQLRVVGHSSFRLVSTIVTLLVTAMP